MKITFHELTLRNFMSYGDNVTVFDLNFTEPTLIVGRNLDTSTDGQIDSNGAGKTTALNAILYALYGKPITANIKVNDLINDVNKKNLEVSLSFEINGTYYKIIRFRKNSVRGGNGAILLINNDSFDFDEEVDGAKTPANTVDDAILQIIGMPFEVCSRIMVFSATNESFLDLPISTQREIIEELFSMKVLSEKAELLKDVIKQVKLDIDNMLAFEEQRVKEVERIELQVSKATTRLTDWDSDKEQTVSELNASLVEFESIDFDAVERELKSFEAYNKSIADYTSELNDLQQDVKTHEKFVGWVDEHTQSIQTKKNDLKKLKKIDIDGQRIVFDEIDGIDSELSTLHTELASSTKDSVALNKEIDKLGGEVEHLIDAKCPYCAQTYKESKEKLESITVKLEQLMSDLDALDSSIDDINSTIVSKSNKLESLKKSTLFKDMNALNNHVADIKIVESEIVSLEQQTNPYDAVSDIEGKRLRIDTIDDEMQLLESSAPPIPMFTDMTELLNSKANVSVIETKLASVVESTNPHIATVEELSNMELDESKESQIDELTNLLEHQQFLLKLLTKKDSFIRKVLLNKSVPFLNSRLSEYLKMLGLPHSVTFNHDMTTSISQFDTEKSYANLSSGQKARINVALSFAFRDVLQSNHGQINFCMLDECLDVGLGNVGVSMAIKLLKKIATQDKLSMYVISHRDEVVSMFNKIITIELDGGFSNKVED